MSGRIPEEFHSEIIDFLRDVGLRGGTLSVQTALKLLLGCSALSLKDLDLLQSIISREGSTRESMAFALAAIGGMAPHSASSIPFLRERLGELFSWPDNTTYRDALSALGKFGPAASDAIPDLRDHLEWASENGVVLLIRVLKETIALISPQAAKPSEPAD